MAARLIPQAGVNLFAHSCPGGMLAVGDSLQLTATVMIDNSSAGMSGPFDNYMLYTSSDNPGAFDWHVSYPPPSTPTVEHVRAGKADVTRDGVLIGRDTGMVYVNATSAGKTQYRKEVRIVPRIVRFAVTPRDTAVQVGDTVWVRATAEMEGRSSSRGVFSWKFPLDLTNAKGPVGLVWPDPDAPERDPLLRPLVAEEAGISHMTACFGGARIDTATIRVSGEPIVVDRDVPPLVRLLPGDTNRFDGAEVHGYMRILNEYWLANGPYRWRVQMGDGTVYEDSIPYARPGRFFGMKRSIFAGHRYFEPARYDVVLTVTDSAGRSSEAKVTYVVQPRRYVAFVLPPTSGGPISLSDDEPNLAIAVLSDSSRLLWAHDIAQFPGMHGFEKVPLLFGRTEFEQEPNGWGRVTRDVNGDRIDDNVFLLDKRELIRNGDMRVGRNLIRMRGTTRQSVRRDPSAGSYHPKVEADIEFTAVP